VGVPKVVLVALSKRLGISRRHLLDLVAERNQLAGHVVSGHAGFDPDEASRHIHESCGNPTPRDFFAQDDGALLIQANHMQHVLAGIDPDRVGGCGGFLAGHESAPRAL